MDTHVRLLGNLNIIYGALSLIGVTVALIVFKGFEGIYRSFNDPLEGGIVALFAGFQLAISVPAIITGIFLKRLYEWARSLMIVVSALNILNFPLGSALGAYGLWVLMTPETEPLFAEPPPGSKNPARKMASIDEPAAPRP